MDLDPRAKHRLGLGLQATRLSRAAALQRSRHHCDGAPQNPRLSHGVASPQSGNVGVFDAILTCTDGLMRRRCQALAQNLSAFHLYCVPYSSTSIPNSLFFFLFVRQRCMHWCGIFSRTAVLCLLLASVSKIRIKLSSGYRFTSVLSCTGDHSIQANDEWQQRIRPLEVCAHLRIFAFRGSEHGLLVRRPPRRLPFLRPACPLKRCFLFTPFGSIMANC